MILCTYLSKLWMHFLLTTKLWIWQLQVVSMVDLLSISSVGLSWQFFFNFFFCTIIFICECSGGLECSSTLYELFMSRSFCERSLRDTFCSFFSNCAKTRLRLLRDYLIPKLQKMSRPWNLQNVQICAWLAPCGDVVCGVENVLCTTIEPPSHDDWTSFTWRLSCLYGSHQQSNHSSISLIPIII